MSEVGVFAEFGFAGLLVVFGFRVVLWAWACLELAGFGCLLRLLGLCR